MIIDPRNAALNILVAYERQGAYPNLQLKKSLREVSIERDRHFITLLVFGLIEF